MERAKINTLKEYFYYNYNIKLEEDEIDKTKSIKENIYSLEEKYQELNKLGNINSL